MAKNALKNFKELQAAHKAFMKLSTDDIGENLEKVGFRFFSALQVGTPKDTSRAVNGWIVVVDRAVSEWKPPKGMSSYAPRPFDITGRVKFNSMVSISNNVEYIQVLDEGHSIQAKSGFTNDAYRQTTAYINTQVSRINRKRYNV